MSARQSKKLFDVAKVVTGGLATGVVGYGAYKYFQVLKICLKTKFPLLKFKYLVLNKSFSCCLGQEYFARFASGNKAGYLARRVALARKTDSNPQ